MSEAASDYHLGMPKIDLGVQAALRWARKLQGLTQKEAAKLAGVAPATISRRESLEENPTVATIEEYLGAIGVTAGQFVKLLEGVQSGKLTSHASLLGNYGGVSGVLESLVREPEDFGHVDLEKGETLGGSPEVREAYEKLSAAIEELVAQTLKKKLRNDVEK